MDKKREEELIRRSKTDPEAFSGLFREYYTKILRYVIYRTSNAEAARDITAETFYKIYKNLWRYKFGTYTFSAWAYKIAGNETVNFFRKKSYEPISLNDELLSNGMLTFREREDLKHEVVEMQEKIENNSEYTRLYKHLKKLPLKYQEAVVLRFLEEKSILEICSILKKKEGTVKSLISRGVAMLRDIMQPNTETDVLEENKEKGKVQENG